ncbi:cleft lip and palate transmembrane protein 1-like protein [Ischnura elegans]|uniref:cleft lip and palate transmembrane protein 1-like protein n=1 Tax=Ischnura elegans TaxID=197161 RepID=UPI001ED8B3AE|nr:cleft lip and palate transmembrane protein 1-like protein [Ischnura elegans]
MRSPSFSLVFSVLFLGFIVKSIWTIAQLFIPPTCPVGEMCIKPLLNPKTKLQLLMFTSTRALPSQDGHLKPFLKLPNFDYGSPFEKTLPLELPSKTRNNGSLYLHIWVRLQPKSMDDSFVSLSKLHNDAYSYHIRIQLTQYQVPNLASFNLIQQVTTSQQKGERNGKSPHIPSKANSIPVSHLKSKVDFAMLTEIASIPVKSVPSELISVLRLSPEGQYLPILQYDFLSYQAKDLVMINNSASAVEDSSTKITLTYEPIGFGKLRLWLHLEMAFLSLQTMGFSDKNVDEVKRIFAETNPYLLCVTVFVASIHLLFDFLAFKNDVSFWRKRDDMVGLSTSTLIWRAFSQFVVFLYLLDENTSPLVLVPTAIGVVIELWKCKKVLRLKFNFSNRGWIPLKIHFGDGGENSAAEKETRNFDAESMKYLSYILYPLCLGGAVYSLIYHPHKGWYSWCVHSLVNGVYAFGFLFMLPQLFVNYRLKSVAHLPWRAFMYKAFNTFIDDLFAFIITMPTAHRVACFRDDIVFLIYLYQRWLYPVDKTRLDPSASMDKPAIDKKNE